MDKIRAVAFVLFATGLCSGVVPAGSYAAQAEHGGKGRSGICTVDYSGSYDWGDVDVSGFHSISPNYLGDAPAVRLHVKCAEPTVFALRFSSDYSAPGGMPHFFGMAPHNDGSPGGYRLFVVGEPSADGKQTAIVRREDGRWLGYSNLDGVRPEMVIGFITNGKSPHAIEEVTVDLKASGQGSPSNELPPNNGHIHFHGTVKVTLEYL